MEDLTLQHEQVHIRRVYVLVREKGWVNDAVILHSEEEEFLVSVIEDGLEIIDFGPRYAHSQMKTIVPVTSDDAQLVADSDQLSEPEKDALPSGFQKDGNQRTAWIPALTLGNAADSKRVGKGQEQLKKNGTLSFEFYDSSSIKAAKGAQNRPTCTAVQISKGSADGLGCSDDVVAKQVAVNVFEASHEGVMDWTGSLS